MKFHLYCVRILTLFYVCPSQLTVYLSLLKNISKFFLMELSISYSLGITEILLWGNEVANALILKRWNKSLWRVWMTNHNLVGTYISLQSLTMFVSVTDPGSAERTAQKRKFPSPPHSSNGHSPQDASTSPIKKKKKPGLLNSNNKEQVREVMVLFY